MTIQQIKAVMATHNISQAQICKDLGFNKGDLSCYLSEKRPLPKSRAKAFYYYFKYYSKIETSNKLGLSDSHSKEHKTIVVQGEIKPIDLINACLLVEAGWKFNEIETKAGIGGEMTYNISFVKFSYLNAKP